jgi:acyl-CoA thioesterase
MGFAALLGQAEPTEAGFALDVPAGWHQGRTAYGGFSAAVALAAARRVGGEGLPPLRSALVSFVGPLAGRIEARATVLRTGRNATWIAAEIAGAGGVGLTASFVFMGPVNSALSLNDAPPPEGLIAPEAAAPYKVHAHMPAFLREQFEVRFALPRTIGARGAEKQPELCWWVRLKDGAGLDPALALLLTADALPPGVLPLLAPTTRVSSMTWQANFLTATPATRDGWWLLRSTGDYAEAGCSSQRMAIWNAAGVPMVAGMQAIALFD